MKKTLIYILWVALALVGSMILQSANATDYPFPQNYTLDQRRFDSQQAQNLVMRRLQPSTTGQWALATVSLESGSGLGLYISTASYGSISAIGETIVTPGYAVKKFTLISIGGLNTLTTNKTDGILALDDGMAFEQAFDYPVVGMSFKVNITTGAIFYGITGVK